MRGGDRELFTDLVKKLVDDKNVHESQMVIVISSMLLVNWLTANLARKLVDPV